MFPLTVPTRESWLPEVLSDLESLLIDHAHCEKKAASTAMALIYRYPERPEMMAPLSRLAREELVHFERVLDLIESRGFNSTNVSVHLRGRPGQKSPEGKKLLDAICCALIEARSHDDGSVDPRL